MKKLALAVAVLMFTGLAFGQKNTCEEKEKEAIIKVIQEEIDAFDARDFDRLAKTFMQDETLQRLHYSKSMHWIGFGWDEIGTAYKSMFEERPTPRTVKRIQTDYRIKVYKESAWASFSETRENSDVEEFKVFFFEKEKGEWKIVFMLTSNITSYEEEKAEGDK